MIKITPFLWFDNNLEDALKFYSSVFGDRMKVLSESRFGEATAGVPGKVISATFEICNQRLYAFNGGPNFPFTEAVSFFIDCENQAEVDEYWEKLSSDGGYTSRCGWLKDKFGLSWQVVPTVLGKYLNDPDPAKAKRVQEAMLDMQKLDIEGLKRAHEGK